MVGGEYAVMVKWVKYEVSCWLNVDNQKIFYFFASLIYRPRRTWSRWKEKVTEEKKTWPTIFSRNLDLMLCK